MKILYFYFLEWYLGRVYRCRVHFVQVLDVVNRSTAIKKLYRSMESRLTIKINNKNTASSCKAPCIQEIKLAQRCYNLVKIFFVLE